MKFSAHVWYGRGGGSWQNRRRPPPHAAVRLMLAEIEQALAMAGVRPIAVVREHWPEGTVAGAHADDQLARITVEAEAGERTAPLTAWFQWQHPRWIEGGALPLIESAAIAGVLAGPCHFGASAPFTERVS